MDDGVFWEMQDEDGFFGEDEEELVASNDPLRNEAYDHFSPYEKYPDEDFDCPPPQEMPTDKTIAVVGAMIETEGQSTQQAFIEDDRVVKYISMNEHLNKKKQASTPLPKRPFEQWVDDVLTGKKKRTDPL